MQALFAHIERIKEKPHHVRKQIAYAYAAIGTAVITLVWLGGSVSTGAFALHDGDSPAVETTRDEASVIGASSLAGAAAAFPGADSGPAEIIIIDADKTAQPKPVEQTVLPF